VGGKSFFVEPFVILNSFDSKGSVNMDMSNELSREIELGRPSLDDLINVCIALYL
jgi:hypothetical protein